MKLKNWVILNHVFFPMPTKWFCLSKIRSLQRRILVKKRSLHVTSGILKRRPWFMRNQRQRATQRSPVRGWGTLTERLCERRVTRVHRAAPFAPRSSCRCEQLAHLSTAHPSNPHRKADVENVCVGEKVWPVKWDGGSVPGITRRGGSRDAELFFFFFWKRALTEVCNPFSPRCPC